MKYFHSPFFFLAAQIMNFPFTIFHILIFLSFFLFQRKYNKIKSWSNIIIAFIASILFSWFIMIIVCLFIFNNQSTTELHMEKLFYIYLFPSKATEMYGLSFVVLGNIVFAIWFLPLWHYWLRDRVLN